MEIKKQGVVLGRTFVGEKDAIIKILTEEKGVLSASVKGIKSMKSKLAAGCALFSCSDFLLTEANGKYIVTSAVLKEGFYGLSSNIERLSFATYIAEVALSAAPAPEDARVIIPLLLNTFYLLANSSKDLRLIKCVFELRLLCALGYSPELDECISCGDTEKMCFFSAKEGGMLCRACGNVPDVQIVSETTLLAMQYVKDEDERRAFSFTLSKSGISEFERCTEKMLEEVIGKRLSSLCYLKQISGRNGR